MGYRIIDNLKDFIAKNADAMDRSLNIMAVDIERGAKFRVPVKQGQLRAAGRHRKAGFMKYVVEFFKEYAGYQEWGKRKDGSHVVRRYTTPGTGKFYLRDAGRSVALKAFGYFKREASRISR